MALEVDAGTVMTRGGAAGIGGAWAADRCGTRRTTAMSESMRVMGDLLAFGDERLLPIPDVVRDGPHLEEQVVVLDPRPE